MYQSAKSKPVAIRALLGAFKTLGMVAMIVTGAIIIVPVGACAMVAWAVSVLFDALRPKRAGVDSV